MNLHDLPHWHQRSAGLYGRLRTRYFRYTDSNRRIANATVKIVQGWLPAWLHPVVEPTFSALISDKLRLAFGFQRPPGWFSNALQGALWLRKWPLRWITFEPYPSLVSTTHFRAYPAGPPAIEAVGPESLRTKAIDD